MSQHKFGARARPRRPLVSMSAVALAVLGSPAVSADDNQTQTPIKHVIVIIGENRTFDHLFATYQPVNKDETVLNLLSQGIVNAAGTPGPNYASATQYQAMDTAADQKTYTDLINC
jgi:phospholipase C